MPRVSLVERYDNRSVIKQIYDLKGKTDKAVEDSADAIAAVNQPVTASVADDTLTIGANGQTVSVVLPAGGGHVWYVTLPSDDPTTQQVQSAYEGANPGQPAQVGYRVSDLSRGITYAYDGSTWVKQGGGTPDEYVKSIGETVTPETGGLKIGWTKGDDTAGALTIPEASSTAPGLLRKGGQPDCLLSAAGPIQGTNGKMQWQSQTFYNGNYLLNDLNFPEATSTADGTMSAADKAKLDTVSQGANKIEIEQDSNKIGIKIDGVETRIQEARPGQIGLMTSQQGTQLNDAWTAVRDDVALNLSGSNLTVTANGKTSAPVALPGGGGASLTPVSGYVGLTVDQSQKGVISIVKADNLKIAGNAHRPVGVTCDIVGTFATVGGSMAVVGVSFEISGDDVIPWITTVGNKQGNQSSGQTVTVWYA